MRYVLYSSLIAMMCASMAHAKDQDLAKDKPQIVGYLERVVVQHIDKEYKAKLDTGADTSSLHAEIIELQEPKKKGGKGGYVIFDISSQDGKSSHIRKPLIRMVRIIARGSKGYLHRPVVEMTFCMAGKLVTGEVNLANRERFNYDVLVGRNMLKQAHFAVDSSVEFTTKPNCVSPDAAKEDLEQN
ncbi:MAG: hypothetical protein EAY65_06210 [Alphaproteobacteria bacterium]|nr:MAG: hypothetical protein EAY65_06210 [Alphaproteobacteria bacterium]